MSTYLKWAAIVVVACLGLQWLSKAYGSGSANLGGGSIVGRGWAAPVATNRGTWSWFPPNGIPHQGGGSQP